MVMIFVNMLYCCICKYVIKGILVHSCAATPISWQLTELMLLCQVGIIAAHN